MKGQVTMICKFNLTYLTFLSGPLPDRHIIASAEKLQDKRPQPGICKLLHGLEALNFVDSKFGPVPFGSLLSYQCLVRGESTAKSLAARILRGTPQTAAMKRGLDLEPDILRQYSEFCDVSVTQCGVIIHPNAPHLASSPDAKVFNPRETPPFGLAVVKSCDVEDVAQVKHLITVRGQACLKKSHKYYYQVQGQLALSGVIL